MRLGYDKPFKKRGYVDIVVADDPEYLVVSHDGKTESIVNPFYGVDDGAFAKEPDLREKIMSVCKYLWLYDNRNGRKVKSAFREDPDEAWAPGLDATGKRRVQVNYDHDIAALERVGLRKKSILEDLWYSAKNAPAPKPSPPTRSAGMRQHPDLLSLNLGGLENPPGAASVPAPAPTRGGIP